MNVCQLGNDSYLSTQVLRKSPIYSFNICEIYCKTVALVLIHLAHKLTAVLSHFFRDFIKVSRVYKKYLLVSAFDRQKSVRNPQTST